MLCVISRHEMIMEQRLLWTRGHWSSEQTRVSLMGETISSGKEPVHHRPSVHAVLCSRDVGSSFLEHSINNDVKKQLFGRSVSKWRCFVHQCLKAQLPGTYPFMQFSMGVGIVLGRDDTL